MTLLEDSIYSQDSLLFGFLSTKQKHLSGLNRRAKNCIQLVKEKNQLTSQMNSASDPSIKQSLLPLLDHVKQKLRSHRRGETSRKRRWKIKKANQAFLKNPFQAGKKVLDPDCNIQLQCQQTILDGFKSNTLADNIRDTPLTALDGLPPAPALCHEFNSSNFKFEDFTEILNSRRNASSPGLNMIPYKVYKKCHRITSCLFKIFQSSLKVSVIPVHWRVASEVYVPNKKPPIDQMILGVGTT